VNAIIPLAILRTLQKLDHTDPVDLEEYAEEVALKRLGMSATVSAQIDRYAELVKTGESIESDEVVQLFRLVGRRSDAELAFSEAGRLAAEEIVAQTSAASRIVHRAGRVLARERVSKALAKRLADRLLDVVMSVDETAGIVAVANGSLTGSAPDGKPCGFFGAALAELLRRCTEFEGAMLHHKCQARGDDVCSWQSGLASV
jgi:predicted hydrocarbon binding protein